MAQLVLGKIIAFIYRLLSMTYRYQVFFHDGMEEIPFKNPKKPILLSHWHRDDIALIAFCRNKKFLTMTSKSKDGALMASALEFFGFKVYRGSSSRGGASALLGLVRELEKEAYCLNLAVDGPRGPIYQAKPGIVFLSSKLDAPIYHVIAHCKRKWILKKTWMKTYIPKPFSRIEVHFIPVPRQNAIERINQMISIPLPT